MRFILNIMIMIMIIAQKKNLLKGVTGNVW